MSVAVGERGPRFRALLAEGRWPPSVVWGSREPGCFFRGTSGVHSAVRAARPPPVQGEGGVSLHGPVQGRYSAEEARSVMLKSVRVGTGARCLQRKGRGGGCVTGPVRGAPRATGLRARRPAARGPRARSAAGGTWQLKSPSSRRRASRPGGRGCPTLCRLCRDALGAGPRAALSRAVG